MPACGGLSYYPRRMGGGKPLVEHILASLNRQRGDGYNVDYSSTVYVKNMAYARALDEAISTNTRMSYQFIPSKMTDMLPRWETILGITPESDATGADRRAAVGVKLLAFGWVASHQVVEDLLTEALGPVLVAVEYIRSDVAGITVPDGSYPFGTPNPDAPWSSSVARILIRVQVPDGMSEGEFFDALGNISKVLEPAIPGWMTYDWYRPGPISAPVDGGPSAAGFYLDDPGNMLNEVFDV